MAKFMRCRAYRDKTERPSTILVNIDQIVAIEVPHYERDSVKIIIAAGEPIVLDRMEFNRIEELYEDLIVEE